MRLRLACAVLNCRTHCLFSVFTSHHSCQLFSVSLKKISHTSVGISLVPLSNKATPWKDRLSMHRGNDFPWRAFSLLLPSIFLNVSGDEAGCSRKFRRTLLFSLLSITVNTNLLFSSADNLSSNKREDDFKPQEQRAVTDLAYIKIYSLSFTHKSTQFNISLFKLYIITL